MTTKIYGVGDDVVEQVCCGRPMVLLCSCVGFRAWWCSACDQVVDVLECGHVVKIARPEDLAEAAPAICLVCGANRLAPRTDGRRANAYGEGAMRSSSLGMARARAKRGTLWTS